MARKRTSRRPKRKTKRGRKRQSRVRRRASRSHSKGNFRQAIQRLQRLSPRHRAQAIGMSNDKFIRQLSSHVKKLKYAQLPEKMKKKLKRHSRSLRTLSNPRVSCSRRRKILSQRGGIFPLLPLILPFIGTAANLIGKAISR